MKRINLSLAFLFALLLGVAAPVNSQAARPNPPTITGTVPVALFVAQPGTTNLVAVAPQILVIDERGKAAANVEATVEGNTATFNIPLKKAGSYVILAYYPEPNRMATVPQVVDVLRKQTSTVTLVWAPQ